MRVDRCLQHLFDSIAEAVPLWAAQASHLSVWMHASQEKGLAGINIPHAHDHRCIHEKIFHRFPEPSRTLLHIHAGKIRRQRLWSQMAEPWVLRQFLRTSIEAHPEASGIMKAQFKVWAEVENQVIMQRVQLDRLPKP